MAKIPGATLWTSNQGSSGRTRWSDLYSGRGSGRHHSGICTFVCRLGSSGAACCATTREAETTGRKGFNTEDGEAGVQRARKNRGGVTVGAVNETRKMRVGIFILGRQKQRWIWGASCGRLCCRRRVR